MSLERRIDRRTLDALWATETPVRVKILHDIVRIRLIGEPDSRGKLMVRKGARISDGPGAWWKDTNPNVFSVGREDGELLQVKIGRTRRAFEEPVDEVTLLRNEEGIWLPEEELAIRSNGTFIRFVNRAATAAYTVQYYSRGVCNPPETWDL